MGVVLDLQHQFFIIFHLSENSDRDRSAIMVGNQLFSIPDREGSAALLLRSLHLRRSNINIKHNNILLRFRNVTPAVCDRAIAEQVSKLMASGWCRL